MSMEKLQGAAAEEFIQFCQTLVKIPGCTGEEWAVAEAVTAQCLSMPFDRVQTDTLGNVIAVRKGAGDGPVVLFDGHMDVVPVESAEQWRHDPHGTEIAEGKLWGRGAADTRASLAGMIWAAGSLSKSDFCGTLVMAATVCEENVTGAALSAVLDAVQPDVVVTGEPTGLRLGVAQKGRMTLFLDAQGRSAHTSTPEAGENAVDKMLDALQRLRGMDLPSDADLGRSLLVLTEIISDPYPNGFSVPHGCHARLIGRTLPGESREQVLGRVQAALQGMNGVHFHLGQLEQRTYTGHVLRVEDFLPGWRNPPGNVWQTKIQAALQAAGLPGELYHAPCGTNASASARRGISSFIFGPGELSQAHTVDEWVPVEDILLGELGFRAILVACLGI